MTVSTAAFISELFKFTERNVYFSSLPNERDDPQQPGERHVLTREIEAVERFVARWDQQGRALYFCVSTMSGKRNKANANEIAGAHGEIDFKDHDVGEQDIWKAIARLRCQPTVIVRSGHGLHLYWLFHEPMEVQGNIERIEACLRQLCDMIGGDPQVCEVARLMRLPGTHNTKGGEWLEVTVERSDGPRYELDDLEEWLSESAPVLRRRAATPAQPTAGNIVQDNPFLQAALALGFKPPVDVEQRLAAMTYGGAGDSSIHSTQLSVSASLLNAGREIDEVVGILLEATRAAAGEYASRWNWAREDKALRRMCITWLAKHPPQPRAKSAFDVEQPERENTANLAADRGEPEPDATPDNVTDLGQARAKRKAKPTPKGDTLIHIVVGEATLGGMAAADEHVLFTDSGDYLCEVGLWTLKTPKDLAAWLNRKIEVACRKLSLSSSNRVVREARDWIIRNPELHRGEVTWDAHGMVPTLSGLINPRTGEVVATSPEHYTTWRVPFAYDPAAACPRWLRMLEDTFVDRDEGVRAQTIQLLQELLGMGLIDSKPKALSLALVLVGGTDYGKSAILNVMGGLFGPDSITVPVDTLESAHGLMPFVRRLPWVLHEAFDPSRWDPSGIVKALLSGDGVQINIKNGPLISRRVTAPNFWGANVTPQFKEATHAIANRLAVVECRTKFDKKTPVGVEVEARALGHRSAADLVLANEMTGVLAWAVVGLRRALVRGMFDLPAESLEAGERVMRDANRVAGFVRDAIAFDPNSRLLVADCWAAFSLWWIRHRGDDRRTPNRFAMGKDFKALNDPRIAIDEDELRSNSGRYYAGIKLNEEGIKLWRQALASEAFDLKGKLGDATSADELPYDDIPPSWDDKAVVRAMRKAHKAALSRPVTNGETVTDDLSPVTEPSPSLSPTQPSDNPKKPLF